MTMRTTRFIPIIVMVLAVALVVQVRTAIAIGEAGATFLKIPVGARESAMGASGTVLAQGPTALRWNPAGLAGLESQQLDVLHGDWFQGMSFQHVSLAVPAAGGVAAVGALYSSSGDISGYDVDMNATDDYTAADLALSVGYGRWLGEHWQIGASGSLLQQTIEDESATGLALDLGLRAVIPTLPGLSAGLAVRNLGPPITFIDRSDPLPRTFAAGLMWSSATLTLAGEWSKARGADPAIRCGAEWCLLEALALRAGYLVRAEMSNALTAGAGVNWGRFRFDYAYVPFEEIADTHHVGISVQF